MLYLYSTTTVLLVIVVRNNAGIMDDTCVIGMFLQYHVLRCMQLTLRTRLPQCCATIPVLVSQLSWRTITTTSCTATFAFQRRITAVLRYLSLSAIRLVLVQAAPPALQIHLCWLDYDVGRSTITMPFTQGRHTELYRSWQCQRQGDESISSYHG